MKQIVWDLFSFEKVSMMCPGITPAYSPKQIDDVYEKNMNRPGPYYIHLPADYILTESMRITPKRVVEIPVSFCHSILYEVNLDELVITNTNTSLGSLLDSVASSVLKLRRIQPTAEWWSYGAIAIDTAIWAKENNVDKELIKEFPFAKRVFTALDIYSTVTLKLPIQMFANMCNASKEKVLEMRKVYNKLNQVRDERNKEPMVDKDGNKFEFFMRSKGSKNEN